MINEVRNDFEDKDITPQVIAKTMNKLLEADPEAVRKLCFETRVTCNKDLAELPFIQVGAFYNGKLTTPEDYEKHSDEVTYKVGLLGILNGITQQNGWMLVANIKDGEITGFSTKAIEAHIMKQV